MLHGNPLYGPLAALPPWPGDRGLPFTYPPIAAVLFAPLTLLPPQLDWGLFAVASALAVGFVVRAGVGEPVSRRPAWVAPVAVLCMFGLEPVQHTLRLGQVNLVLMALIMLDLLVLPRSRWTGGLTGLAAAIKLTPLVFVVYLAVVGRRADALRALGSFTALNALGAVLLPADTGRYWSSQVLNGDGATSNSWIGNQSLNGLIQRASGEASWAFGAAFAAGAACLVAAMLLARRLHARGEPLGALLVAAFAGVLASPISWTHHWVWVVPAAGLLIRRAVRSDAAAPRMALAALVVVFTGWTMAIVPSGGHRETGWNPLQALVGNAYVLTALAAFCILAQQMFQGTFRGTFRSAFSGPDAPRTPEKGAAAGSGVVRLLRRPVGRARRNGP